MSKLTPKQAAFVGEYLVDLNATQAAIRSGYSAKTASWIGPQLLGKSHVSAAIQEAMGKRERRTAITQDRVLLEYARIAFFDPAKLFDDQGKPLPIASIDEDTRRAVCGVDICTIGNGEIGVGEIQKLKIANKLGALDSIGKHLGMFRDGAKDDDVPRPTLVEVLVRDARKPETPG